MQLAGCDLGQGGAAALAHLGAAHQQGDRPVGVHAHLSSRDGRGARVAGGQGHGPATAHAGLGRGSAGGVAVGGATAGSRTIGVAVSGVAVEGAHDGVEVGDQVGIQGALAVDDGVAGGQ